MMYRKTIKQQLDSIVDTSAISKNFGLVSFLVDRSENSQLIIFDPNVDTLVFFGVIVCVFVTENQLPVLYKVFA